jgi:hypothetical protein
MKMHLVLIETSGNQDYIFATNKLKENIGASELTYRSGTQWVLEAVGEVTGKPSFTVWKDGSRLRKQLLDPTLNLPIEQSETMVEIVVAASGKALLLTKTAENARTIIQKVTHRALLEAPGLEICGIFQEFDWQEDIGQVNQSLHHQYEQVKSQKLSSNQRFLRLPVVDQCHTSGLPANQLDLTPEQKPISQVAWAKRQESREGIERLVNIPQIYNATHQLIGSIDTLETYFEGDEALSWLAIIHADGNGLGEIFLKFHQHLKALDPSQAYSNRSYIDTLRKFSIALDICTECAFTKALSVFALEPDKALPLVPLILGGDDLTVVTDGRYALPFTHRFLVEFEQETQKSHADVGDVIPIIAKQALGVGRLSVCAGVAIVKPHFPFSVAYDLAESLIKSAKQVKIKITQGNKPSQPYPCSALDFHVLYDSSHVSLKQIRAKLEIEQAQSKTYLYNRPYVITPISQLEDATEQAWAEFHHWQHLIRQVKILTASDSDGKKQLPNSQVHDLRSALFLGQKEADARYQLIRHRYRNVNIIGLEGMPGSLFSQESTAQATLPTAWMTGLMDAIDAADFLQGAVHEQD